MAPVCKPPHNRGKTFILEWREASGMTQEQIAKELKVKQPTISKLESGKTPYNQDFLERLAVLLKARPADLISRRPDEQMSESDPPHVVTVKQRDELNDTIHLLHAVELAVLGSELDDFEQCALNNLVRLASSRLKALSSEFDAETERERS
jgi:transcriptional regulator with XRE-family HTH domain